MTLLQKSQNFILNDNRMTNLWVLRKRRMFSNKWCKTMAVLRVTLYLITVFFVIIYPMVLSPLHCMYFVNMLY